MWLVVDALSWLLILAGSFFVIVGAVGMMRMPDAFTRLHAASVMDTLGAGCLLVGMLLQAGFSLVALKLLIVIALFFFVSPVVTHALAQAALAAGCTPEMAEDRRWRIACDDDPIEAERQSAEAAQ